MIESSIQYCRIAPLIAGVAIGSFGGFWAGRLISQIAFVEDVAIEADAATFTLVLFLLLTVGLLAIYIPAHRAARIDPLSTLRHE